MDGHISFTLNCGTVDVSKRKRELHEITLNSKISKSNPINIKYLCVKFLLNSHFLNFLVFHKVIYL